MRLQPLCSAFLAAAQHHSGGSSSSSSAGARALGRTLGHSLASRTHIHAPRTLHVTAASWRPWSFFRPSVGHDDDFFHDIDIDAPFSAFDRDLQRIFGEFEVAGTKKEQAAGGATAVDPQKQPQALEEARDDPGEKDEAAPSPSPSWQTTYSYSSSSDGRTVTKRTYEVRDVCV